MKTVQILVFSAMFIASVFASRSHSSEPISIFPLGINTALLNNIVPEAEAITACMKKDASNGLSILAAVEAQGEKAGKADKEERAEPEDEDGLAAAGMVKTIMRRMTDIARTTSRDTGTKTTTMTTMTTDTNTTAQTDIARRMGGTVKVVAMVAMVAMAKTAKEDRMALTAKMEPTDVDTV
ncbi:hypothetical protein H0H87_000205 [Tephrocybe sp. NHM501043]|nr:hypothetical protein H0H87_000205 [Tephrocybe sp. NHM501043]